MAGVPYWALYMKDIQKVDELRNEKAWQVTATLTAIHRIA
jgi:hypothetical protein